MSQTYINQGFEKDLEYGTKGTNENDVKISFKKEGPWARRSKLEKGLIFFLVILVLAVIGLVIAVVLVRKDDSKTMPEVCGTPDCAEATARLIENMDMSVDPCEDFYQYSCGSWKKKHVIPEDRSGFNVFGVIRDNVQVINKYLLEDTMSYPNGSGVIKAKDMYSSCVDLEAIESKNTTVAIPLLGELGGWPVLESNPGGAWAESEFDLSRLLIKLREYNNRPLMDIYISSDSKDSEKYIIYLDQPDFGLPGRTYYLEENLSHMREAYVTLASSIAKLFGANATLAEIEMREVLAFETDLANISMRAEDRRDNEALYNKMTISELKQNFTEPDSGADIQFDWLQFITGVFDIEGVKIAINHSEPVVVRAVPYFEKLFNVLQKHRKRVVANYMVWYIMQNRARNLDNRFRDLITEYNEVVYGTSASTARWKSCVDYTVSLFGMAVGHMFVKETFDESAKSVALDMIGNIRDAFNELLDELDWMDEPTKELAREKAKAMREWIGYPDDVIIEEKVNELYENATIDKNEYFKNVLNNLKNSAKSGLQNLRIKYNKNVWTTPPSTVNAFYSSIRNNIMFPAGILQPPFYSKDQPKSMNYGGIGVVIGHEITHGFDDRGRQYDKNGNLQEWWDASIIANFKDKAKCIVDQYNEFIVPEAELNVNGINTQGENIADNGGLKQSFRAYRKWVEQQGREEPLLPGLNFTNNQLFFINFAQIWCNNMRKEGMINSIKNGVHSPGQFRVIGTLQNSRDFANAFSCKNNHYMNPQNKCYVW
ncbi:neprilysin-like isoform X2 [Ruditapes philippinarum]|uniref:neprilysin-like isoform X2 n=1 Tax=Ruditapes philippinarum TaxID=129788 RepID=UPI00295A8713|nr:neprilysin-like isoform X2 [Ruditapes philippinarum]